jgi:aspartyl/glutamyl-tRNA(Asn/Gln) amidotransferase C subunit
MSKLLDHLCQLARLKLADDEREEFSRKFASLLAFIEHIKEVSALAEDAPLHVPKENQELRSDSPEPFPMLKEISGSYAAGHIGDLEENE